MSSVVDLRGYMEPVVPETGVAYLYRFAEGEAPVRRFLQSYRDHSAGFDHDLIVIFKGFPDRESLDRARMLFDGTAIKPMMVEDTGFDIGSYLQAARASAHRRLLFLNTYSELLADNWLRHFDRALALPGVGIAGATGSWLARTGRLEGEVAVRLRAAWRLITRQGGSSKRDDEVWTGEKKVSLRQYLFWPLDYIGRYVEFGRYPNPHIRTNAFMMERELFLSLAFPEFATKEDVYRFESGRRSITKQIMALGLKPVVVDRSGKVYDVSDWNLSGTFWIDDQRNLLVADNRTTAFAEGNRRLRRALEDQAWNHPWHWNLSSSSRFEAAAKHNGRRI